MSTCWAAVSTHLVFCSLCTTAGVKWCAQSVKAGTWPPVSTVGNTQTASVFSRYTAQVWTHCLVCSLSVRVISVGCELVSSTSIKLTVLPQTPLLKCIPYWLFGLIWPKDSSFWLSNIDIYEIGMDTVPITTSSSDGLFSCINIDDYERPWTSKIRGFIDFCDLQLQCTL